MGQNDQNEDDMFGRYVGLTLKTMTQQQKRLARLRIEQVLFDVCEERNVNSAYTNRFVDMQPLYPIPGTPASCTTTNARLEPSERTLFPCEY